jgi:hypothetical protein
MTRRRTASLAVLLAALVALAGIQASSVLAKPPTDHPPKILEFQTMVGVPPAFLSSAMPQLFIRGIPGPGAAWTLTAAKGELTTTGHLEIKVDGLVVANSGSNPSPFFRAIVSCLDSTGATVNLTTGQFPATTGLASANGGDSTIEADVALPHPCIAPIVFVTNANGTSWFASTGG